MTRPASTEQSLIMAQQTWIEPDDEPALDPGAAERLYWQLMDEARDEQHMSVMAAAPAADDTFLTNNLPF